LDVADLAQLLNKAKYKSLYRAMIRDVSLHWCKRRGCRGTSTPPKVLIWWKSGQNLWKPS